MIRFRIGQRILKTGLAVFITAQICSWLGWPSIFAIIAAIVTIEPSVNMSIKKGLYRLPSAGIGAAIAMIFDAMLGQQPVTYMLSAVATIYLIQLLKWNDSLVIATLTSVNMVTLTDAHFFDNFLVRLGTTTIGIVVSALINYLISPPKYMKYIEKRLPEHVRHILQFAHLTVGHRLNCSKKNSDAILSARLEELVQSLSRTQEMVSWQLADHPYKLTGKRELRKALSHKRSIRKLQSICSSLDTMIHSPSLPHSIQEDIATQLWKQWHQFDKKSGSSTFITGVEGIENKSRMIAETLFCQIEFIHRLLRQLPKSILDQYIWQSIIPLNSKSIPSKPSPNEEHRDFQHSSRFSESKASGKTEA